MKRAPVALALLLVACVPDLGTDDGRVTSPRVLAVRADPAEARPGAQVTFTALVAGPRGTVMGAPLAWAYCAAPKPLTEDNVVSTACLGSSALVPAGAGPSVTTTLPTNACALFGPDSPPGGFRPRAPDITGGYYQPLRVDLPASDAAFALARVRCNLGNASADAASAFAAAYVNNQNPRLRSLLPSIGGAPASLASLQAGARVTFEAGWAEADAESYAYFDISTQAVTTKREAMSVAWYASAGAFDTESTGRAESDRATTTTNTWTAPGAGVTAHLWVILRDSRGGVDFAEYDASVVP